MYIEVLMLKKEAVGVTSEYPQGGDSVVGAMIIVLTRGSKIAWFPTHVTQNESTHKMVTVGKRLTALIDPLTSFTYWNLQSRFFLYFILL